MEGLKVGQTVVLVKSSYMSEFAKNGNTATVTEINPEAKLVEVKTEDGMFWMFYEHEVKGV